MQDGPTKHAKLTGKRDPRDVNPIPLMPVARKILLERSLASDGYLFPNRFGGPKQRRDVQRAYVDVVEEPACLSPLTAG